VDPERIFVGNGGMEVISLFLKSLPRESNIVVEETTYDRVLHDAERYGHNLIGVELTSTGVNLEQLREVINKVAVVAFYGIPTAFPFIKIPPVSITLQRTVRLSRKYVKNMVCFAHGIYVTNFSGMMERRINL
jgi:hypothetical protein